MRLLTHNSLRCPAKDVTLGSPLGLEIEQMEVREAEANLDFMRHMLPTLDWGGVLVAATAVGLAGFPAQYNDTLLQDEDFLKAAFHLLVNIHVEKGTLICPESGRRFPIDKGIPNMMLPEAEV